MSLVLAVISHSPILGGLGELVDFLDQWSWILRETVEGTLPPDISPIIDELRQHATSAREVVRCLELCKLSGRVPDGDILRRLERKLAGVRHLKMDIDVRLGGGENPAKCKPCLPTSKQVLSVFRLDNAADCSTTLVHRGFTTTSAVRCTFPPHDATRPTFQAGISVCLEDSDCLPSVGHRGALADAAQERRRCCLQGGKTHHTCVVCRCCRSVLYAG